MTLNPAEQRRDFRAVVKNIVERINDSHTSASDRLTPELLAARHAIQECELFYPVVDRDAVDQELNFLLEQGAAFNKKEASTLAMFIINGHADKTWND